MDRSTLKRALKTSSPVILGYIPAGFAFGLLITASGFSAATAVIMSTVIYAGAGQYLAVAFFTQNVALFEMAITTFLINSKHLFYGLSLISDFKNMGWRKPYMIFSLTDETYAILTSLEYSGQRDDRRYMFYIAVIDQISWIFGSFLGAVLGTVVHFNTTGLDFAMTALFFVILTDQLRAFKTKLPFAVGIFSALAAMLLFGKGSMLLVGAVLAVILLILSKKVIEKNDN